MRDINTRTPLEGEEQGDKRVLLAIAAFIYWHVLIYKTYTGRYRCVNTEVLECTCMGIFMHTSICWGVSANVDTLRKVFTIR